MEPPDILCRYGIRYREVWLACIASDVFLRRNNVCDTRYMCCLRGQLHTVAKQIKSRKNASVSGKTPGKRLSRVLNTSEKDLEKSEN